MNDWIRSQQDLVDRIRAYGFLPFFGNEIPGFSIEEHTPRELWYNGSVDGRDDWPVWDWKGPVIQTGTCAYGKFFQKKAGYVSLEWLPDFCNARRNGMDLDEAYEAGGVFYKDKAVYDAVRTFGAILTPHLKYQCNFRKGGSTGFDSVVTRLQMQTYLCIADFVYREDRFGKPYGWGVAQYALPEQVLGYDFTRSAYRRAPEESRDRLLDHMKRILPDAGEKALLKLIG